MTNGRYVMTAICADRMGIAAAVTGFLAGHDAFILESHQYADLASGRFFMRTEFTVGGPAFPGIAALRSGFAGIAERFAMDWVVHDLSAKPRVVIMVSKFGHCLNDLLHRWRTGTLPIDIPLIISNHGAMRSLAEWHRIDYLHLPVTPATKEAAEAELLAQIDQLEVDFVVLARYMQVLSNDLCRTLSGRCINIHHSFLPSFKGARPYHQAHERGVKLIGATAHFVTADLDEGPIIEQDSLRVDHALTAEDLVTAGRDVETQVLARAVTWVAERRVLTNGSKTVVFRR